MGYNSAVDAKRYTGGHSMKHLTAVLALCLLSATVCVAQQSDADQPATKADIDRYYDAMRVRDMMKATMDAVSQQMRKVMHDQLQKAPNLPPDAEEKMNQFYDKMLVDMPINDLLDAMEPVYAKHFTKGDIDAMIAFYSTPTGKKALAEMPAITQEAMQASSGVLQKYMEHVETLVDQQIAQMEKDAQTDPKKATTHN
jgi:uncharacterized protein